MEHSFLPKLVHPNTEIMLLYKRNLFTISSLVLTIYLLVPLNFIHRNMSPLKAGSFIFLHNNMQYFQFLDLFRSVPLIQNTPGLYSNQEASSRFTLNCKIFKKVKKKGLCDIYSFCRRFLHDFLPYKHFITFASRAQKLFISKSQNHGSRYYFSIRSYTHAQIRR